MNISCEIGQSISISTLRLRLEQPLPAGEAPALRDFFGRKFADEVHTHSHNADGSLVYLYPRVQFKVVQREALLLGVNEGSDLLQELWSGSDRSQLGYGELPVLESTLLTMSHLVAITSERIEYRFVSPWLALNQKNFIEYTRSRNQKFRKEKLANTLVGNCLGMCKSLGLPRFGPDQRLTVDCSGLTSIKTTRKGQGMIGFIGKFTANIDLPDYIGLGQSVSVGFGTIETRESV